MKKIIYSIVLVSIGMFLMSCGSNPQKQIIGKWENTRINGTTLEFFKDGTIVVESLEFPTSTQDYEFIDKNHIKIVAPATRKKSVFSFSLSGNELIWTIEGQTEKYRRIK